MIDSQVNYLDDEVVVDEQEPSTFDECREIMGSEAAAVKEIVDNIRYRNKHPRVYKLASKELEALCPRTVKGEKKLSDGTVRQIFDSHIIHLRACFKKDPKKTTEVITRIAQEQPIYVKGERRGFGGRISKGAMDLANSFFAEGDDVVEDKVTQMEAMVPNLKIDRDEEGAVTPESLARGIQALQNYLTRQAQDQAKAMLGTGSN